MPVERRAAPHLQRWHDELATRPAWEKYVALPLT
jgi:glutathione S-transferase